MATTTSLTLRALFGRAASKASLDRPAHVVAGLTPAAKAFAATVSARTATGITLFIVPTDKDVDQMTSTQRSKAHRVRTSNAPSFRCRRCRWIPIAA